MVSIRGWAQARRKLQRLRGPEMVKEVGAALFAGGSLIQTDAQHSITQGSVSGKGHVPSRPGDPPNADTHALDRQIETVQMGPLSVQVQSNDPKSKFLEYGTSRMAARPYMGPAEARNHAQVVLLVRQAVNRVIKRIG
jgi:HK97 gp10 family phage protein